MINEIEEFRKAEERAKRNGRKQALLTGLLEVVVVGVALFNGFPWPIKLLLFLVLQLILGLVISSKWMRQKREI